MPYLGWTRLFTRIRLSGWSRLYAGNAPSLPQHVSDKVPNEIWDSIASYLELPGLKNFRLVSRAFDKAAARMVMHTVEVRIPQLRLCLQEVVTPRDVERLVGLVRSLELSVSHDYNAFRPPLSWDRICLTNEFSTDGEFYNDRDAQYHYSDDIPDGDEDQLDTTAWKTHKVGDRYSKGEMYEEFLGALHELRLTLVAPITMPVRHGIVCGGLSEKVPTISFLHAAKNLQVLKIGTDEGLLSFGSNGLASLTNASCWPSLREFYLQGATCYKADLMDFIKIHSKSLRNLTLSDIFDHDHRSSSHTECWVSISRELALTMRLERLEVVEVGHDVIVDNPWDILDAFGENLGRAVQRTHARPEGFMWELAYDEESAKTQ